MQLVDETAAIDESRRPDALGVCRATYCVEATVRPAHRPTPARALVPAEVQAVLDVLHEDRFVDQAPAQVRHPPRREALPLLRADHVPHPAANDEGARTPPAPAPAQSARAARHRPNQLWSWDITKLKGPTTWSYYYLYVIIDVFSRYVVGWMVAPRERQLAEAIAETCERQASRRPAHRAPTAAAPCAPSWSRGSGRPRRDEDHCAHASNDNAFSRPASRRSSTGLASPALRLPEDARATASTSSPGTTASTTTAASASRPRVTSLECAQRPRRAPWCSRLPTPSTRALRPRHTTARRRFPPPSGSTSPKTPSAPARTAAEQPHHHPATEPTAAPAAARGPHRRPPSSVGTGARPREATPTAAKRRRSIDAIWCRNSVDRFRRAGLVGFDTPSLALQAAQADRRD
ncbi:MAG: transposase family protein [Kofleriaceae bacterium]|nr:transposase family protein [Kofleriaceae bacterium]